MSKRVARAGWASRRVNFAALRDRSDTINVLHPAASMSMAQSATVSTQVGVPDTSASRNIRVRLGRILPLLGKIGLPPDRVRLVGGLPRALLTTRDTGYRVPRHEGLDVDLVMESDAVIAGIRLRESHGGELTAHWQFANATWHPPKHFSAPPVDLITARSESYPQPGQLPEVELGSFADDCHRRDFTVNTLALDLVAAADLCAGAGQCLVHHHPLALEDLEQGIIRVLHAGSFVDDPTRLFRAVRYEQRLGFRMAGPTLDLFRSAVAENCPATVSGTRIRREVELAFLESRVAAVLNRLAHLGLLARMGLTGARAADGREACGRMSEADANRIGMGWLLLLGTAEAAPSTVGQALDLPSRMQARAEVFRSLLQDPVLAEETLSDLALARRLGPVSRNEIVLRSLQVYFPHLHTRIDQLMARAADPRPRLDGSDLIQLGYTPGRTLGRVLEELLVLRLAGKLRSIEDERAWVREHGPDMQAAAE